MPGSDASALAGDPRRPNEVVAFKRPPSAETDKIEVLNVAGMILGLIGVMTRVRLFSLIALAFIASSFIQRTPDTDTKQLFMSAMFSVAGFFFSAFTQPQAGATNTTAAAGGTAQQAGTVPPA